jgi:hypothetical protein
MDVARIGPIRRGRVRVAVGVCVVSIVLMYWFVWSRDRPPIAWLAADATSVSYDAQTMRLTATLRLQNNGDRPTVALITKDVFVDSQKQPVNRSSEPQPWRTELIPKRASLVTLVLEGEPAAAVWNGVRLMEVTVDAAYRGNAKLDCHFSFMGRLYPVIKQIGTVSSVTSPRQCRRP